METITYKQTCQTKYSKNASSVKKEKAKLERVMARQFKKEERREIEVEMQMFPTFATIMTSIPSMAAGIKTAMAMNSLDKTLDAISGNLTSILADISTTTKTVSKIMTKQIDVVALIRDIMFEILHLTLVEPVKRCFSILLSLSKLLLRYGLSFQFISDFKDWFRTNIAKATQKINVVNNILANQIGQKIFDGHRKIECKMQSFDNIEDLTTISPTYIILAIVGVLSIVFQGVLPTKTKMETMLKRMGDLGKACKGIQDFDHVFHDSLAKALDYYRTDVLGLPTVKGITEFVSNIDTWFKEVDELGKRDGMDTLTDKILKDPEIIIKVEDLYKRGNEFSKEIAEKRLSRDITLPFMLYQKRVTEWMKIVDTSGAFGTKPRTQPIVIWLYGESGVGKSGMSWPLAIDLNNLYVPNSEQAAEFSKHIYMRNVEQEFWDNYSGQNVVIYDDFGQLKDTTASPNAEFMELIRTANIAPYPLHMAHLEDKRKARFTSKVILLTSNILQQNVNSLTFPDAFRRRIDLCARVRNKDEFTKSCFSQATGECVPRLDKEKVKKHFGTIVSTEVYELDIVNAENGEVLEESLSYEDFLKRCKEVATKNRDSSVEMNEFLTQYAGKRYIDTNMQINLIDPLKFNINESKIMKFPQMRNFLKSYEVEPDIFEEARDITEDGQFVLTYDEFEKLTAGEDVEVKGVKINATNIQVKNPKDQIVPFNVIYDRILRDSYDYSALSFDDVDNIFASLLHENYHTFNRIYRTYLPRKQTMFSNIYKNVSESLSKFKEWAIRDIEENPIYFATQTILVVATLFSMTGIWSKIFPQPPIAEELCNPDVVSGYENYQLNQGKECKRCEVEAKPSGDMITQNLQKVRYVEANPSGDMVTQNIQKVKHIEANASGDNVTMALQKQRFVEIEEIPTELQMWKDQTAQNLITARIFSNLYKIAVIRGEQHTPLLNGLFVRANIMLVPGHLLDFIHEDDILEIVNSFDVNFKVPFNKVKVVPISDAFGDLKEAALLSFPSFVSSHSDLVKHFQTGETMAQYKRADVCLPVLRYSDKMKKHVITILGYNECTAIDEPVNLVDKEKGTYVLRKGLEYRCATTAGDCGAPVILNETQILRKIAGIHVAGSRDGNAYAESITQKDLERAFTHIEVEMQIITDCDEICIPTCVQLPACKFLSIGQSKHKLFEPNKTEIRASIMYDVIKPTISKPAILYHPEVNMKHKNLEKCAMDTPFIDDNLIEQAYNDVRKKWLVNARPELQRVLTWEEVIKGSDISEFTGPINRTSSPGYPWVLEKKKGTKGKQGWFGSDDYVLDEDVLAACVRREEDARMGKRTPTIWVDTLKDERRPIAKVDALKTRVFSNGPMDYNLVFRKYYLSFIAHLMENRVGNEVAIGTNVYSRDWKNIYRKLTRKGTKVVAGDFSTFDGSLNVCIMAKFCDMANEFYDDGESNALVRRVLIQDVYNSIHLCDDVIYMMTHSQPSGNPATTPLNCFVNSMGVRICFAITAKEMGLPYTIKDFDTYVSMISYGDDNIINFHDSISEWFNMESLTTAFAQIGFTYTDELKSGKIEKWRDISEIAFLKRKFLKENNVVKAPLDLDTVLEMISWVRGDIDQIESCKINCETAVMELSLHPKEIFDQFAPRIQKEFLRRTKIMLDTDTYKGYNDERYKQYYI